MSVPDKRDLHLVYCFLHSDKTEKTVNLSKKERRSSRLSHVVCITVVWSFVS